MTTHTPAAKASGASPLLAFLSSLPSPNPPAGAQDFSAVILEALTAKAADSDSPANPPPDATCPATVKHTSPDDANLDPASRLLALLACSLSVPHPLAEWHDSAGAKPTVACTEPATSKPARQTLEPAPAGAKRAVAGTEPAMSKPARQTSEPAAAPANPGAAASKDEPAPKTLAGAAARPAQAGAAEKKPESTPGLPTPPKDGRISDAVGAKPADVVARTNSWAAPPDGAEMTARPAESATAQETNKSGGAERPVIGTTVALSSQRMNFRAERNEIAGRTEQKLPPGAVPAVTAVDAGAAPGERKAKAKLDFAWCDTPPQILPILDPAAKSIPSAVEAEGIRPAAGAQLGLVEQLITREAGHLREKGAESLGVSLKVDAQTQLFLQLTNKNGQLQASLRCERGDFSALDTQWAQLQQALARQNVQLMPLGNGVTSNFQEPPEHRQRPLPPSGEESPAAGPVIAPATNRKPKPPGRSRQRWESWA